jgi:PQQ-dependent catabolism-associated CXXCW motif protein
MTKALSSEVGTGSREENASNKKVRMRFRAKHVLGFSLALFCLTCIAHAEDRPSEPEGYRTDNYRAPVPATLAGARVLTTGEAEAIWRAGNAAFVDVLPRPPKPPNLPAGTVWRDKPRFNIPGSLWLPDTGYGLLASATEDYLRRGLANATGGDLARLLVVYCQADCWMSWNAAKRALSYGYRNVAWYPDGTDGWQRANLPLTAAEPRPRVD